LSTEDPTQRTKLIEGSAVDPAVVSDEGNAPHLSVVIPLFNEESNLRPLYERLQPVLEQTRLSYEVIFVDDGSTDDSSTILKQLHQGTDTIRIVHLRGNFGKSVALQEGFSVVRGKWIITLDGDLQDEPTAVPAILEKLKDGYDVVSGWRRKRNDRWLKVMSSKLFNRITAFLSRIPLHDFNCGLKGFTREAVDAIHLYGELHRFIPVLAKARHFRVGEVLVAHNARHSGRSKYGMTKAIKGMLDLCTVLFLIRFSRRPFHFFGSAGLLLTSIGFVLCCYISYLRFQYGSILNRYPLLLCGILLILTGFILFSTGFVSELLVSQHVNPRERRIRDIQD